MMDSLESIGAKGTYFVDYLMIKKLRDIDEEKARKDLLLIEKQLVDIVKKRTSRRTSYSPSLVGCKIFRKW